MPSKNSLSVSGSLHHSANTHPSTSGPSGVESLSAVHRRHSLEGVTEYIDRNIRHQYLQLIHATILVTASDQLNASWPHIWMLGGACVRMCLPMRINESSFLPSGLVGLGERMRVVAGDALEQAEMGWTWWMSWLMERTTAMWTTRPAALSDDEITCELPVLRSTFQFGKGKPRGAQTFHSLDLYFFHPPQHVDSIVMLIKATKLFGDTLRFFCVYEREQHSVERYLSDSGLWLLLSHVNAFSLSIPAQMRKPTQKLLSGEEDNGLDRDALAAPMMAHLTSVVLGEPLVTPQHWQHDVARKALASIRAILSMLYDGRYLNAVLPGGTLITEQLRRPVTTSHCCPPLALMYSSGPVLLRFLHAATQVSDGVTASIFRGEIGVFQYVCLQVCVLAGLTTLDRH